MTHEYPHNQAFDSVRESRVSALGGFGFTPREREFLVTVMVHAGCFLERQYCAFTRTVRGQNSRELMARLAARGFVRVIEPGPVRRGRLYHVHHKPLYEAIGQADNRNRRLRIAGREAVLEDLDSKNGTFVGPKRIDRPIVLAHDDVVRFGSAALTFRVTGTQASTDSLVLRIRQ